MKNQEHPPHIDTLETPPAIPLEHTEVPPRRPLTEEEQKKVETLTTQTQELAGQKPTEAPPKEEKMAISVPPQEKKPWWKKLAVAAGFMAATVAGTAQKTEKVEKDVSDSKKTELVAKPTTQKMGLSFYKGGKTREGSVTPTGKLNAFEKGKYSEEEVYDFAIKHGLRTTNNKDFQEDLFNIPGIKEKVLKEYGQTASGTLLDGILGARVEFAMDEVEKEMQGESSVEIIHRTTPEKDTSSLEIIIPPEEIPVPNFESYDSTTVLFDFSASMKNDLDSLAAQLGKLNIQNKSIEIVGFTDKKVATLSAHSSSEAQKMLEAVDLENYDTKREVKETTIQELVKLVQEEKNDSTTKKLYTIYTDEVMYTKGEELALLEKEGKEKNITYQFIMRVGVGESKRYEKLDLPAVLKIYKTTYENRVLNRLTSPTREIQRLTKQIESLQDQLLNAKGKEKTELENQIKEIQELIQHHGERIDLLKEVAITGYENRK